MKNIYTTMNVIWDIRTYLPYGNYPHTYNKIQMYYADSL